jgi:hypothetical protein
MSNASWKDLPETNTIAYLASSLLTLLVTKLECYTLPSLSILENLEQVLALDQAGNACQGHLASSSATKKKSVF